VAVAAQPGPGQRQGGGRSIGAFWQQARRGAGLGVWRVVPERKRWPGSLNAAAGQSGVSSQPGDASPSSAWLAHQALGYAPVPGALLALAGASQQVQLRCDGRLLEARRRMASRSNGPRAAAPSRWGLGGLGRHAELALAALQERLAAVRTPAAAAGERETERWAPATCSSRAARTGRAA